MNSLLDRAYKYTWYDSEPVNYLSKCYNMQYQTFFKIRVALFLSSYLIFIFIAIAVHNITNILQYFTLWGDMMVFLYQGLALMQMVIENNQIPSSKYSDKIWQFSYILFEIAFSCQITITFVFWAVLFPQINLNQFASMDLVLNCILHGGFTIIIWVEFYINCIPFHQRHLLIIMIVCFVYMWVNLTYTLAQNTPVYPGVDYVSVFSYVTTVGSYVMTAGSFYLGHFIFYQYKLPLMSNSTHLVDVQVQNIIQTI